MKIIADENLAFTEYFFSEWAEISHHAGRSLTAQDLQQADALLVRSVTMVNESLLQDSQLQFVGSATIGTDHLDLKALAAHNIRWANAAGCNAQAVAEYVITALLHLRPELLDAGQDFCLGVVGLGNVGSRLASMAQQLDWKVMAYDPLQQRDDVVQVSWQTLLAEADAISIHVPLTRTGDHATYHLFNAQALAQMKPTAILINSARGAVVVEADLIADIQATQRQVVLDVFEHEPIISASLLQHLALATPHIAGYSLEGKARGTQMIYQAFCQHFNLPASKRFESQLAVAQDYFTGKTLKQALRHALTQIYNIAQDDANLRACVKDAQVDPQAFDALRKNYPLRREWAAHGGPQA